TGAGVDLPEGTGRWALGLDFVAVVGVGVAANEFHLTGPACLPGNADIQGEPAFQHTVTVVESQECVRPPRDVERRRVAPLVVPVVLQADRVESQRTDEVLEASTVASTSRLDPAQHAGVPCA